MEPKALFAYKGVTCKQNPLTGDWLVVLGDQFGAYYCATKQGCKQLIDDSTAKAAIRSK